MLAGNLVKDGEHLGLVVVAPGHVPLDVGPLEPFVGQGDPALDALAGQLAELGIDLRLVGLHGVQLVFLHGDVVEAERLDALLDGREGVGALDRLGRALQRHAVVAVVLVDDGHEELAHDVAAHDDVVDLVELGAVQKLAEGALRTVDVGREEESRLPWSCAVFLLEECHPAILSLRRPVA